MESLEFYSDFGSPYGYIAARFVEGLASKHNLQVDWRPFRLGVAVVQCMGLKPLLDTPLKGDYVRKDVARMATALSVPLCEDISMFDPVPAQQIFHSVPRALSTDVAKALLNARWADEVDIGDTAVLTDFLNEAFGFARDDIQKSISSSGFVKLVGLSDKKSR